jgi:hypothetical protein
LSLFFAALVAGSANAQACGDLDEVPQEVYAGYVELLADLFPLPSGVCDKLSRGTVASCHRAVSTNTSCIGALIRGVAKAGRTACGAQAAGQEECIDQLEQFLTNAQSSVDSRAREAHEECDAETGPQLWSICFGPG